MPSNTQVTKNAALTPISLQKAATEGVSVYSEPTPTEDRDEGESKESKSSARTLFNTAVL